MGCLTLPNPTFYLSIGVEKTQPEKKKIQNQNKTPIGMFMLSMAIFSTIPKLKIQ